MNKSRINMTVILRRTFSKKYFKPLAGVRSRIQQMEQDEQDVDIENVENDDLSEFEGDFMNVGESHKIHEREMRKNKERLKQHIVNQKYFKEQEPRFLTLAERQLIRKLYESNPEEWTIEKLSESFPALPETIQKILHTNWSPKSVERVIQYDHVTIENWKKLRAGKLPVSPKLNEHLMKFKNRKIILTDRESLAEQFVNPAPKFNKPKSRLFSNIIQSYLDEKYTQIQNDKLSQKKNYHKVDEFAHSNKNQNLLITDKTKNDSIAIKNSENFNEEQHLTLNSHIDSEKYMSLLNKKKNNELLTFNEFVKAKLENIYKESPKEGITLLNLYRKQMDANQEMQTTTNNIINNTEKNKLEIAQKSNKSVSAISENKDDNLNIVMADNNLIDTTIKVWNKKIDSEYNYAKPIMILKNLHKPGMTYRIRDCYYDDDGEFLYKVPGVQT